MRIFRGGMGIEMGGHVGVLLRLLCNCPAEEDGVNCDRDRGDVLYFFRMDGPSRRVPGLRQVWTKAAFPLLLVALVALMAACDIVLDNGPQRGRPSPTPIQTLGNIIVQDGDGTPAPTRTRTPTATRTPTPTITPGTPTPTATRTITLTPPVRPTAYATRTPLSGPPTVTPRGADATLTPTATEPVPTEPPTAIIEPPPVDTPTDTPEPIPFPTLEIQPP